MTTTARACPSCGETAATGDRFCEGCGAPLPVEAGVGAPEPDRTDLRAAAAAADASARDARCPSCDGDDGATDGYCDGCGRPRPSGRDRVALALRGVATHTDRGRVRARNEDAFAAARVTGPDDAEYVAAFVCDGVGSVRGGEVASLAACEAAVEAARRSIEIGETPEDASRAADAAARTAVAALAGDGGSTGGSGPRADPPACTYVAAVVAPDRAVVSWAGDSRAYWLAGPEASRQLTVDDSWAAEVVAAGLLEPDAAWADPRAHVITRWLAADAPGGAAHVVVERPPEPGVLLLCSDGLWNHIPDPADLARLLVTTDPAGPASASALVGAALDDGGHDNVTVALVSVEPAVTPTHDPSTHDGSHA